MKEFIKVDDISYRLGVTPFGISNELSKGYFQLYLFDKANAKGLNILSFCSDGIIVEPKIIVKGFGDITYDKV